MTLSVPVPPGFFPQLVLGVDDLMTYRRLGRERVDDLVRIVDDADCRYDWAPLRSTKAGGRKAQVYRTRAESHHRARKSSSQATLLKASVQVVDVTIDEVLEAIARVKTKDSRRTLRYLYGDNFVDTQTLLTFPVASGHKKPAYAYRALKWCLLRKSQDQNASPIDFSYLEYAGKKKATGGDTSTVGFCIQESVSRDQEVPKLNKYGIQRGMWTRTGIIITRTQQQNVLQVTSVAQINGELAPPLRSAMEALMSECVGSIHRVRGLLERQRVGRLQYLEEWDWVASADRKCCNVCQRGFYFRRKQHCQTCGEVVCASCAPLRELEEPLFDITHLRVCSQCMAQAAAQKTRRSTIERSELQSSNGGTETYIQGLANQQTRQISIDEMAQRLRHGSNHGRKSREDNDLSVAELVERIRQLRTSIDGALSEVGSNNGSDHSDVYSRIRKLRDKLDVSGSNIDAVLASLEGQRAYAQLEASRRRDSDSSSSIVNYQHAGEILDGTSYQSVSEHGSSDDEQESSLSNFPRRQRNFNPDRLDQIELSDSMLSIARAVNGPQEETQPRNRMASKMEKLQRRLDNQPMPHSSSTQDEPEPEGSQASSKSPPTTASDDFDLEEERTPAKLSTDMVHKLRSVMSTSDLVNRPPSSGNSVHTAPSRPRMPPPPAPTHPWTSVYPSNRQRSEAMALSDLSDDAGFDYDERHEGLEFESYDGSEDSDRYPRPHIGTRRSSRQSEEYTGERRSSREDEISLDNAEAYFDMSDSREAPGPSLYPRPRKKQRGREDHTDFRDFLEGLRPRKRGSSGQSTGAPSNERDGM